MGSKDSHRVPDQIIDRLRYMMNIAAGETWSFNEPVRNPNPNNSHPRPSNK